MSVLTQGVWPTSLWLGLCSCPGTVEPASNITQLQALCQAWAGTRAHGFTWNRVPSPKAFPSIMNILQDHPRQHNNWHATFTYFLSLARGEATRTGHQRAWQHRTAHCKTPRKSTAKPSLSSVVTQVQVQRQSSPNLQMLRIQVRGWLHLYSFKTSTVTVLHQHFLGSRGKGPFMEIQSWYIGRLSVILFSVRPHVECGLLLQATYLQNDHP